MTYPLITTIILTYRRPHLLKKALQSVLSQTYPHFQVIICDNASGDETASVVAEFAKKDPRIKYFCHEKNIGMLGNYQFGLSLVNTDFFSFLSDDDAVLPNFYETTLQEFQKHPDAGFVAGSTIILSPKGRTIRIPLSYWPREGKYNPPDGALEMIGKYPVPTSVLFSKKVIKHVSIDFENPIYWDCDYLFQTASIFPIVISKKPCAIFRHHDQSFSNQKNSDIYEEAFNKLLKNIQKNKNLTTEKSQSAISLILYDLAKCRKHFFLLSLMGGKFEEAYEIAKIIQQHPAFKYKSLVYICTAKICKVFPVCLYGIRLLKSLKPLIWNFKNRKNKKYASYLN